MFHIISKSPWRFSTSFINQMIEWTNNQANQLPQTEEECLCVIVFEWHRNGQPRMEKKFCSLRIWHFPTEVVLFWFFLLLHFCTKKKCLEYSGTRQRPAELTWINKRAYFLLWWRYIFEVNIIDSLHFQMTLFVPKSFSFWIPRQNIIKCKKMYTQLSCSLLVWLIKVSSTDC